MCLQTSLIKPWNDWNWNGDEIVHLPIVPAARPIPGSKSRKRYPIDIREYLTTTNNAVVGERLGEIVRRMPANDQNRFRSKSKGSFDFRADTIAESFQELRYISNGNRTGRLPDAWLYPDETLAQRGGDCEDLAFLMAALLLASGISGYCVRVALGTLHIKQPGGKKQSHSHAWVMYQNEGCVWEILEPLTKVGKKSRHSQIGRAANAAISVEYVPRYVFNTDHLWQIHSRDLNRRESFQDYCHDRRFWNHFNPSFAASVHSSIYDLAFSGRIPAGAMGIIKRTSLWLDVNILTYDPRDHFDNGYIAEGWTKVNERLVTFRANQDDWESFGKAAHSIGDFYAHSSYVHFAKLQNASSPAGSALIHQPDKGLVAAPQYTSAPADPSLPPFDLTSDTFTTNPNLWEKTKAEAAAQWSGKLISGRYAQKYDPSAGFFEGLTSIPSGLASAADYFTHGSLPHHNEIAVDDQTAGSDHKLYRATATGPSDRQAYANQFRWRKNTAIYHLQKALAENYLP